MSYENDMVHTYIQGISDEKKLRAQMLNSILDVNGKIVIDYGCGDGSYLGEVAHHIKKGYGYDKSKTMIEYAQATFEGVENLTFKEAPTSTILAGLKHPADIALTSFVLMAIQSENEIQHINNNLYAALNPGGELVHLITHPCFADRSFANYRTSIGQTGLTYHANEAPFQYILRTSDGTEHTSPDFIDFHHTLESHLNSVINAGFHLQRVQEFYDTRNPKLGGETRVPAFLAIKAEKQK